MADSESPCLRFPSLSLAERDRRWQLARDFMDRKGLDCLLIFGSDRHGLPASGNWFTNDRPGITVLFPRFGAMVGLCWSTQIISSHLEASLRGEHSWISDLRRGNQGRHIVAAIQDLGFEHGTIGVMGLTGIGPVGAEGEVPYKTWVAVLEGLPRATFMEIEKDFCPLMLVLSAEEQALVQRAAEIGELAVQTMIDATRVGRSEVDIYAATLSVMVRNVAWPHQLILQTGPENSAWGPPHWMFRSQPPRIVQEGDIVMAELFPHFGLMEAQQQACIAVGKVSADHERLAELARASYEAGLEVLKRREPTFGELCEAMEKPVREGGAWHMTPLVQSMNPIGYTGSTALGIERNLPGIERYQGISGVQGRHAELVLRPGMTFAFEPNAHFGKKRVNIGGTVIVWEDGPWELNHTCNWMQRVPA